MSLQRLLGMVQCQSLQEKLTSKVNVNILKRFETYERSFDFFDRTALLRTRVFATWVSYNSYRYLPSSLDHLLEIRSRAYVSPVMMYLPVSPVAPPKMTTLDFETAREKLS